MEDFFKSIKAILYDRITSPFYGTFIISWLLWNWKIVYITLVVSENKILINKIDYIIPATPRYKRGGEEGFQRQENTINKALEMQNYL